MATCSLLLNHFGVNGWLPMKCHILNINNSESYSKSLIRRNRRPSQILHHSKDCLLVVTYSLTGSIAPSNALTPVNSFSASKIPEAASNMIHNSVLADLDPDTARLAIGFLGPFLSAFSFLFILRIVMSWYPKLPVGKFPYVIAYAPTEPLLILTRKLIPPLAGVDVTPVVWFGLISFLNEILVGPQGLLVLLSQQVR